jgi:hypothetical protein
MISSPENLLNLRTIEALIFPEAGAPVQAGRAARTNRSLYQRFAIPHLFQPELTPSQALTAALRAFLRIFLGSVLFAVCGAYSLLLWTKIPNLFLRIAAMITMLALFLVLLGGVLIATTLLLRPRGRSNA